MDRLSRAGAVIIEEATTKEQTMEGSTFASDTAILLRRIAEALDAGKYADATNVVVSFYVNGQLVESRGNHKPRIK